MSDIKIPESIHHSAQYQQQDLGDTIFLFEGEGPGGTTAGTIFNAEEFGFPAQTEEIDATAKAFADKVVRAYNAHDALLEALEECERELATAISLLPVGFCNHKDYENNVALLGRIRDVLDKAKTEAKGETQ